MLYTIAHADSLQYSDTRSLEIDMSNVTIAALKTVAGDIIEAELEMEYDDSIWETDIVNDTGRVVKVVVDAQSG